MLERAQLKMLPVMNRASEYAPIAPACCNICRTCTTTNVVGLAVGGVTAAAYGVARFARRILRRG